MRNPYDHKTPPLELNYPPWLINVGQDTDGLHAVQQEALDCRPTCTIVAVEVFSTHSILSCNAEAERVGFYSAVDTPMGHLNQLPTPPGRDDRFTDSGRNGVPVSWLRHHQGTNRGGDFRLEQG